jgi:hypothetical protein
MSDLLLLFDAESILPGATLAETLPGCRVRVFDPTLVDKARHAGLAQVEFTPFVTGNSYDDLCRWAHTQAAMLGARLQSLADEIEPGVDVVGWQHLNLYYQFLGLRWYSEMWAAMAPTFDGDVLHMLVNDNPGHYYWPSFVPGVLLMQQLRALGSEFRAFNFGARHDASLYVPLLDGEPLQGHEVLTHLPTCFYDRDYLVGELAASGRPVLNLPARQWNIELPAGVRQLELGELERAHRGLPAAQLQRFEILRARVHALFDEAFAPWLPSPHYRERQAAFNAALLHSQLILYAGLERQFGARPPRRVLMSEHDAGFHGPLLSWAQKHQVQTLLVPHAKTMWDIEFPCRSFATFTHPLQAESLVDAHGRHVPHHLLGLPEALKLDTTMPGPLQSVSLLLNGLMLGGVACTPYDVYAEGIAKIARWCRLRGVALKVRSRPGQVMTDLLVQAAGLSAAEIEAPMAGPLADFVAGSQLCLMYDAPTNAAADFLRAGVPILNPVVDVLSRAERMTCSGLIVPREDLAATLDRLDHFVADPQRLQLFRTRQFARYAALFEGARPLRQFL